MEESRLKPMQENYDEKLFKELYERTHLLRRKLAFGIDHRRFGVDKEEVMSWFDVKFIYAFNKYYGKKSNTLLMGYILQSLAFFKNRIIRAAYTVKYSQTVISTDDVFGLAEDEDSTFAYDLVEHPEEDSLQHRLDEALGYLRTQLSDNALMLLELQLNPPPYIMAKARELGLANYTKIPNSLYAEYLELGTDNKAIRYINSLKEEIQEGIGKAQSHFALQLSNN